MPKTLTMEKPPEFRLKIHALDMDKGIDAEVTCVCGFTARAWEDPLSGGFDALAKHLAACELMKPLMTFFEE